MSQELAQLLVYTVGVKARGFNKKETYAPTHVVSLSESSLSKLLRDEATRQDFVSHNRTHLVRAYPRGRRLTSTNFVPHHMWAAGIQLVALNWQTFDIGMELNSAMFARAGRCGYVLKPEYLRKKGAEKDKIAALRSVSYTLEVEVRALHSECGNSSQADSAIDYSGDLGATAAAPAGLCGRRRRGQPRPFRRSQPLRPRRAVPAETPDQRRRVSSLWAGSENPPPCADPNRAAETPSTRLSARRRRPRRLRHLPRLSPSTSPRIHRPECSTSSFSASKS